MPAWLLAAWIGACGADAASTHVALRNDRVYEVALSQNPWVTDGLVGAQAGLGVWSMGKLHRRHPKLATGVLVGLTALRVGAAAQNIEVIRRVR